MDMHMHMHMHMHAHLPRTCCAHAIHCTCYARAHLAPPPPQVSRVYVLGLPANADTYLHLAGRTGRWPRPSREDGEATVVTIATEAELRTLRSWSNMLGGAKFTPID